MRRVATIINHSKEYSKALRGILLLRLILLLLFLSKSKSESESDPPQGLGSSQSLKLLQDSYSVIDVRMSGEKI